jgi:hypothetical protein
MSAMDFETGRIEIGHNASGWGPFTFDFSDGLPDGINISSVTVKSYLGRVGKDDDLSAETETTSELVATAATVSSNVVSVFLTLPSTSSYFDAAHSLVFEYTTDNVQAGTHSAFFYRVQVVREA